MRRILVAIDDSEASVRAADFVHRFFADMPVEILAVNVAQEAVPWVTPAWGYGLVAPYAVPPVLDDRLTAQLEADATRHGEEQIEHAGLADADRTIVEFGDPATEISRAAVEHDVDIIVVGAHDRGVLRRLLQGSVADDLVRHAPRPVLVVRDDDGQGAFADAGLTGGDVEDDPDPVDVPGTWTEPDVVAPRVGAPTAPAAGSGVVRPA